MSPRRQAVVLGVVAFGVVVSGGVAVAVLQSPGGSSGPGPATVSQVVDGDTFDVVRDNATVRVRLLNVDTPETVDPDQESECGGVEASEWLAERLPIGSRVELAHDVEKTDRYGRELAWVTAEDGGTVNLEIARAGLGAAVVVEPNRTHYGQVLAAQEEARSAQAGLFDPGMSCTLPAQVTTQVAALGGATGTAPGGAAAALDRLEAALTGVTSVEAALASASSSVGGRMLGVAAIGDLRHRLDQSRAAAAGELTRLRAEESTRAQRRQDEARRQADGVRAEARAAEERRRPAGHVRVVTPVTPKARAGTREDAPEPRRRVQNVERTPREQPRKSSPSRPEGERATPHSPAPPKVAPPSDDDGGPRATTPGEDLGTNPPGYTGPRCYEPGGKTWRPC